MVFWNTSRRRIKTSHPKAAQSPLTFHKSKDFLSMEITVFIGQLVKQFKEWSRLREGMENIMKEKTELIASVMCYSWIESSKFSRLFSISVRKEEQVT